MSFASVALLLGFVLALRALPTARGEEEAWRWRLDGPLLLGAGFVSGALQSLWLAGFAAAGGQLATSDFGDWCAAVATVAEGDAARYPAHRARLTAELLAPLARRVGVADAILWGATISGGALASALYLWGRALHGRVAGLAASAFIGAVPPVLLLSRTVSFYPEATAIFAWGMALAAAAARWPKARSLLGAGIGLGLCLLVELRGLIWALPGLGVAGLGLLLGPWRPAWSAPSRLVALFLPLALAWTLGPWAYHERTGSLEEQADVRQRLHELGHDDPRFAPPWQYSSRYIWGRTSLADVPNTLLHFKAQTALIPPIEALGPTSAVAAERARTWAPLALGALALGVWSLWRRWPMILALALTSAPFLVALQGALTIQQGSDRFMGQVGVVLPLWLGLGLAALGQGAVPAAPSPAPSLAPLDRRGLLAVLAAWALAWALTLGVLPSALSPVASWRPPPNPLPDGARALRCYLSTAAGEPGACEGGEQARDVVCLQALRRGIAEGKDLRIRRVVAGE
jgi:hypothetical protein